MCHAWGSVDLQQFVYLLSHICKYWSIAVDAVQPILRERTPANQGLNDGAVNVYLVVYGDGFYVLRENPFSEFRMVVRDRQDGVRPSFQQ